MNWTGHHGAILAQAFERVLEKPENGVMAFVRCLTPDVVRFLACDKDHFHIPGWKIWRVTDAENRDARTITADQAVEIREEKADPTLLLVDTGRAGAGMDGIFSATREVSEKDLFRETHRLAAGKITKALSAGHRKFAERAVGKARRMGGSVIISPWTKFNFYCNVGINNRPAGAHLPLLGLWPVKGECGGKDLPDLDTSRRFVDRLLDPGIFDRTPADRINGLRLLNPTKQQLTDLEKFLRVAATSPLGPALALLDKQESLWVNSLQTESAADSILDIKLTPWRTPKGKVYKWSGLEDRGDEVPRLIIDPDEKRTKKYAKLEIRWKARPSHLKNADAEYHVAIFTSQSQEEIASYDVTHAAKVYQKYIFTQDDFPELSEDSVIPARVVLSVVGNDSLIKETEEFEIVCGQRPDGGTPLGKGFRAFSDALIDLGNREEITAMTSLTKTSPSNAKGDFLVWKSPEQKKNFRVYRPPLIREAEDSWRSANGTIGRWRVKVRLSGERVGSPKFISFVRPDQVDEELWKRAQKAGKNVVELFGDVRGVGTVGGIGQVYDDQSRILKNRAAEYIRSWIALLGAGEPQLALAQTVEIQSQSGDLIGLIVLPGHPLRMAWHAAYDNLVLNTVDENHEPAKVRKEMEALDGSGFPAFLPGLDSNSSFVFADTLGFHAVGMVDDKDPEPKSTLAILQRAMSDKEEEGTGVVPTVGSRSAEVLGKEICKYLESHVAAKILHVHALRAGDGKTVVRALGRASKLRRDNKGDDQNSNADEEESNLVYVLEIHPSQRQRKRGVPGRYIAESQEKRRRGAGKLERDDRWMLESITLPGGVRLPKLRWARKEGSEPKSAAHLALAFDTFTSRVQVSDTTKVSRPIYAFGLIAFLERRYSSDPHPSWNSVVPQWEGGESHPAGRAHTERLRKLQDLIYKLVARNLDPSRKDPPILYTEISPDKADSLDRLHGLCDWVITLDRNAGIEYFDSPHHHREAFDKFVIDCVPEREDLGCLQLITSTTKIEEVQGLLDDALKQMGLSHSRRNAEFLMSQLKALSGRLAIRLTGGTTPASELISLALSHANCHGSEKSNDCWVSLKHGFIVPVDDVVDLLPPVKKDSGAQTTGPRPDLIYITEAPRLGLSFTFIEVKYRRHLRAARSSSLLNYIRRQTTSSERQWFQWYSQKDIPHSFHSIRKAKLARVLRFYADKGHRHGLPKDCYKKLIGEINRMVEKRHYPLIRAQGGGRGWVFCPEYRNRTPLKISPSEWDDIGVFLFGPGSLPDLDWGSTVEIGTESDSGENREAIGSQLELEATPTAEEETVQIPDKVVKEGKEDTSSAAQSEGEDEVQPEGHIGSLGSGNTQDPSIVLGHDRFTSEEVKWSLTTKGNPHLLVAGLPGMGKTTCLLNLCKQMLQHGVRPIVFSYHQDIDQKLLSLGDSIRFIDFDGLGFNPLLVFDRSSKFAHLDVAGMIRDIFMAIYPELGQLQGGDIRKAVKESFQEAGWGMTTKDHDSLQEPPFRRFLEILRTRPKPNVGLRNLLQRLDELDDYRFFHLNESQGDMWECEQPTVIRIHRTQSDVLQKAFSSLILYGLYKNMFKRGIQDRITHAVIVDEAHRAAKLTLIPTMAKECRKYGVSLVLASQEAKDFHASVFSAIANYLVMRLNEPDAKALVKNVASSKQQGINLDKIKQMERFKALYFSANRTRPSHVDLPDFSS